MTDYTDQTARAMIRDLERSVEEVARQQAVTGEVLKGIVRDQSTLSRSIEKIGERMQADEKDTAKYREGVAVSAGIQRTRTATIGAGILMVFSMVTAVFVAWIQTFIER